MEDYISPWRGRSTLEEISLILFLLHWFTTVAAKNETEYPMQNASSCFNVKGVPILHLKCAPNSIIKVHEAFHGVPRSNSTCWYDGLPSQCTQPAVMDYNCNGRYTCSVPVSNPFLVNCRTYAQYMQVNYTCVPREELIDICRSSDQTLKHGFLRTPNFPHRNYSGNLDCACKLTVKEHEESIALKLLDLGINTTSLTKCNNDWLKIGEYSKRCGHIPPEDLPENIEIQSGNTLLHFHSDGWYNAKGFWVEFSAFGKEINIKCGPFRRRKTSKEISQLTTAPPTLSIRPTFKVKEVLPKINVIVDGNDVDNDQSENEEEVRDYDDEEGEEEYVIMDEDEYPSDDDDNDDYYAQGSNEDGPPRLLANVDQVQIITGCVVGGLILIAVIIIIVLVFRR
ncbi:unnamed protein product [Owenia fusiformis]|uniref:Uncharacterized protein n=1 Tax=Owenia fusiformis TaxID=6347 RepID=A0A8J1TCY7_OWEFU|nr:unnamed protein product [Owenia fusiformis]